MSGLGTTTPTFQFVNGNGDQAHATQINNAIKNGFEFVDMVFNLDQTANQRLVVLLKKK
jgi:hypothetical protein